MVVTLWPSRSPTETLHDRTGCPPTCTVQAQHWAMPQPYLAPLRPSSSRRTHSSGVSASDATVTALPLMVSLVMRRLPKSRLQQGYAKDRDIATTSSSEGAWFEGRSLPARALGQGPARPCQPPVRNHD